MTQYSDQSTHSNLAHSNLDASSLYGLGQVADRFSKQEIAIASADTVQAFESFKNLKREQIELMGAEAKLRIAYDQLQDKKEEERSILGEVNDFASQIASQVVYGKMDANYTEKELLELRLQTVNERSGIVNRELLNFTKDYLRGNTINLYESESSSSLARSMARGDLAIMLNSFANSINHEEVDRLNLLVTENQLVNSARETKLKNWVEIANSVDKYLENNKAFLNSDNKAKTVENLITENKFDAAINLSNEYFSNLTNTTSYKQSKESLKPFVENFATLPSAALREVGISTGTNSALLEDDSQNYSRITNSDLKNMSLREARQAIDAKQRLWDTHIPWKEEIAGQRDVEFLSTSYASLKRMTELVSSVVKGLDEINNSSENLDTDILKRKSLLEKFWARFFETRDLQLSEMLDELLISVNKVIGKNNNGLAANDTLALVVAQLKFNNPDDHNSSTLFEVIFNKISSGELKISQEVFSTINSSRNATNNTTALSLINSEISRHGFSSADINTINSSISNITPPYLELGNIVSSVKYEQILAEFDHQTLSSHEATFKKAVTILNTSFRSMSHFIDSTNLDSSNIPKILNDIRDLNSNHPEKHLLESWIDSFYKRFEKVLKK